jgi:hypothetical protein
MKNLFLTMAVVLSLTTSVFSQNKKPKSEIMSDSLWTSVYKFCKTSEKYLDNESVTQADVNNYINYVYNNMTDSLQSSEFCFPYTVSKNQALAYLTEQTKDMVGQKCVFTWGSWDGYDGKTPYTGFRFDISHNGYKDQFLVIVSTTNKVHCIFSVNSKI